MGFCRVPALAIVSLVMLVTCAGVAFADDDEPSGGRTNQGSIPAPLLPLTLHESTSEQAAGGNNSCVQPAGYSYDDVNGVVDCTPVLRSVCNWIMVCFYRRTKSCFPPETQIQMADGSSKAIEEIRSGDMVWN